MRVTLFVGQARDLGGERSDRIRGGGWRGGRRRDGPSDPGQHDGACPAEGTAGHDSEHEDHVGDHNDRVRHRRGPV